MEKTTIPLILPPSQRGWAAATNTDQYMQNVVPQSVLNSATQSVEWYGVKRGGFNSTYVAFSTAASTVAVQALHTNANFSAPLSTAALIINTGGAHDRIYVNGTEVGGANLPGTISTVKFTDGFFASTGFEMFTASDRGGYYLAQDAWQNTTFVASTVALSNVLRNVTSFVGIYPGQLLGVASGGTPLVSTYSASASTITMTAAASGNGTVTTTHQGLAQIVDSNFPTNITGDIVELDGRGYVMTLDGTIRESDQNAPWSWPTAKAIPANQFSDRGESIAKYRNFVIAFGSQSAEFFYNAGVTSGSVLRRQDNLTFQIGIGNNSDNESMPQRYIAQVEDYLFFAGNPQGSGCPIYVLDGFRPKKITYTEIETAIGSVLRMDAFKAWGYTVLSVLGGRSNGQSTTKWFYFLEADQWVVNTYNKHFTGIDGGVYAGDTGKILKLDNTSFLDNGSAYSAVFVTSPRILNGGERFRVYKAVLISDTEASGTATLEVSKNDYSSFQTIGTYDMTAQPKELYRLGIFQGSIILRLTHSANTTFRPQAIILYWEPCTS